jgi:hypothetical protein
MKQTTRIVSSNAVHVTMNQIVVLGKLRVQIIGIKMSVKKGILWLMKLFPIAGLKNSTGILYLKILGWK